MNYLFLVAAVRLGSNATQKEVLMKLVNLFLLLGTLSFLLSCSSMSVGKMENNEGDDGERRPTPISQTREFDAYEFVGR
jgi:hypothetical protein